MIAPALLLTYLVLAGICIWQVLRFGRAKRAIDLEAWIGHEHKAEGSDE